MRGVVANGEQLRVARVARGWTQEQLASQADVDAKTVRKAEQGKRIDLDTLTCLAKALKLSIHSAVLTEPLSSDLEQLRRQVIERWVSAWDAQDIDAVMELFHDDAVMHLPGGPAIPFGGRCEGKAVIRLANEQAWDSFRTMPVSAGDYSIVVNGDRVILHGIKSVCLPDGRQVPLTSVHIYQFDGQLISEMRVEYDTLALDGLQQFASTQTSASHTSTNAPAGG